MDSVIRLTEFRFFGLGKCHWVLGKNWAMFSFFSSENSSKKEKYLVKSISWVRFRLTGPTQLHHYLHYSAIENLLQNTGFCIFQKYLIIIMIIFYFILFYFLLPSNISWFLFEGILHALPPFFTSIIFPPLLFFKAVFTPSFKSVFLKTRKNPPSPNFPPYITYIYNTK